MWNQQSAVKTDPSFSLCGVEGRLFLKKKRSLCEKTVLIMIWFIHFLVFYSEFQKYTLDCVP